MCFAFSYLNGLHDKIDAWNSDCDVEKFCQKTKSETLRKQKQNVEQQHEVTDLIITLDTNICQFMSS